MHTRINVNSDKKQNINNEDSISNSHIYNSEKKNIKSYFEFRNYSPSPTPNPEAKQMLHSWLKNEKEAYEIKEKLLNNSSVLKGRPHFFDTK